MESSLITVDPRRFNKRLSMEFTKKLPKLTVTRRSVSENDVKITTKLRALI